MSNNELPRVSVVIPCRNEEKTIRDCVLSLRAQRYPETCIEILVADGRSTDRTREIIAELSREVPSLRLIDNPKRISPAAMNAAIQASTGRVIVLLGAHSTLSEDYIALAVDVLCAHPDVDCVGGLIQTVSETPQARAIALAMSSPFGVGDAKFRFSHKEELVDTVAFGAYRREVFDEIGYFDENLPSNDDDEFNYRLRKAGGKILLRPAMRATYYARPTLRKLWRQYFAYGKGKVAVAMKHPGMMRLRHAVPALFVVVLIALGAWSIFSPLGRAALTAYALLYLICATAFAVAVSQRADVAMFWRVPPAFLALHLGYGLGTLSGGLDAVRHRLKRQ